MDCGRQYKFIAGSPQAELISDLLHFTRIHNPIWCKVQGETTVIDTISSRRDAWSDSEWNDGVQINRMQELTTLAVRTSNSLYEITIINGHTGDVLVRGGEFSPVRTAVRLEGSTCGGSILK